MLFSLNLSKHLVALLTHLPCSVADAETITQLYLRRWNIEEMFRVITDTFNCELNILGYPKAALFFFCMAVVAFNILSTVKAALKSVHGIRKVEASLFDYSGRRSSSYCAACH